MDKIINLDLSLHLKAIPRQFSREPKVISIGYLRDKAIWMEQVFNNCNFSFVLQGQGEYVHPDCTWPVIAPCVLTQQPGVYLRYGPYETWEELFLIYHPLLLSFFQEVGYFNPTRPVWYLEQAAPLLGFIKELSRNQNDLMQRGTADRIDRLCEGMIQESLINHTSDQRDVRDERLRHIRKFVDEYYLSDLDGGKLADEAGMAPATFRRHWHAMTGVPPWRYIVRLRLRHASRLLVETTLSISEIAETVNFSDPLYFSRCFRQHLEMSPSEYRERYQLPFRLIH